MTYEPLKDNWKVDEDSSIPAVDQIKARVNSEDWYTVCKGFPIIKSEDISGRLGAPIKEHE